MLLTTLYSSTYKKYALTATTAAAATPNADDTCDALLESDAEADAADPFIELDVPEEVEASVEEDAAVVDEDPVVVVLDVVLEESLVAFDPAVEVSVPDVAVDAPAVVVPVAVVAAPVFDAAVQAAMEVRKGGDEENLEDLNACAGLG